MADNNSAVLVNFLLGALLKKVVVPTEFHEKTRVIKNMQQDDVSGLVDSLTDFAVNTASVEFGIETDNDELNKILSKWLQSLNKDYRGKIPIGIKSLAKEYFKERWKASSFPVLKIAKWNPIGKLILPTKLFFVDGSSIYAKDINEKDEDLKLIGYDYYLGKGEKNKLNEDCIFSRPYGRWFDKYPNPYLIKRGIYHNWKIIESIKNKETELLDQVIPYLLQLKKGTEALALAGKKIYQDEELELAIKQLQTLVNKLNTDRNFKKEIPVRATQFDDELKHLIPDISALFNPDLFAVAEKNILSGLGFIDIAEAVTTSRRESILNPKVFIEEVKAGVEDFKILLTQLIYLIQDKNDDSHRKYMNEEFYITSSPIKGFMTDEFKNQLRLLWKNGQLSDQTYSELVGEVDFRTEVHRREKEVKDGTEIIMYPHITQNREDTESFEEIKRQTDLYEVERKVEDKDGKPLPPDKTEPEEKEEYDIGGLVTAPYKTIKALPSRVKKNLSPKLQSTFLKVFNNAYNTYKNETHAWRMAWSIIKRIGRKNKKGIWVRDSNKLKLTKSIIKNIEKEINLGG